MKPCAGNAWPLVFLNLQSIENLGMVMAGIDREGKPGIASEAATAIWSAKKPIDCAPLQRFSRNAHDDR